MAEIFGRNPVLEALRSESEINKIYVAKGDLQGSIKEIIALAKEKGVQIQQVERAKLDKMFPKENHQGVAASIAEAEYVDWQEMVELARSKGEDPLIIVLDELEDPHNLGAILRTADAVGAHGVVIPKRRAASLTSGVAKAAAGAVAYVPVARVSNLGQTIEAMKKAGLWIAGAAMGGREIYKQDMTGPLAIVIGSEGKGLGRLVTEKCDFLISLPMHGQINSLNASVACGVILYEVLRQRSSK